MVSVSTDIASSLSLQAARAKAARDDTAQADQFSALVDQQTSITTSDLPPTPQPDAPAPARRDDPPTSASDRRDDTVASPAQDRRDSAKADTTRPDSPQKSDKPAKSDQPADSKTKASDKPDDGKTKSTDTAPTDAGKTDTAAQPTAVVAVPVIVPVATTTDTAAKAPDQAASGSQPLAIATAAALKAKLDASGVAVPTDATAQTADPAVDSTFAALIAGAGPAKGTKVATTEGKTATKAGDTKADDKTDTTTAVSTDKTALDQKPATDAKPAPTNTDAPKPDANAVNTDAAKPAEHRDHGNADQTVPANAAPDLTAQLTTPLAQPSHLQQANAATAAQQAVPQAAANPVPLAGVAVEIAQSAKAGKTSFDIRLDPAELGRIDVRLEMDKHGNVTSHLTVEKPETLTMLRQDAPQLQRALEQAGLKTGDSGLQFSLRDQSQQQQQQQQQGGDQSGRLHRLTINDDDTVTVAPAARGYGRMLGAATGVDISI